MDWIIANKEWFFSGLGVVMLGGLVSLFRAKGPAQNVQAEPKIIINNNSTQTATASNSLPPQQKIEEVPAMPTPAAREATDVDLQPRRSIDAYKNETRILFIDDDARFKVAKILVKSGWVHTKLIKDATTLDDRDILDADILFIDVQGVGVELGFADEGLGLALAIKEKYARKKVVIYSAETKGDRFHAALRRADACLSKNADPYEFQKIVEDFTVGTSEVSR